MSVMLSLVWRFTKEDMMDVYQALADKITDEFGENDFYSNEQVVSYLSKLGVIDYDTLKEIFLYPEEE